MCTIKTFEIYFIRNQTFDSFHFESIMLWHFLKKELNVRKKYFIYATTPIGVILFVTVKKLFKVLLHNKGTFFLLI